MDIARILGFHRRQDYSNLLIRLEYDKKEINHFQLRDLGDDEIIIGRAPKPEQCKYPWALPDDGSVSKMHARISLQDGKPYIRDLGSTNGTFCKGKQILKEKLLSPGDEYEFGNLGKSKLIVQEDEQLDASQEKKGKREKMKAPCAWLKYGNKYIPIHYNDFSLGANDECDFTFHSKMGVISRKHAIITRMSEDNFIISDNNSKNGTRVNSEKIGNDYPLQEGDVISIGDAKITFLLHHDPTPHMPVDKLLFSLFLTGVMLWGIYIIISKGCTLPPEHYVHKAEMLIGKGEYTKARKDLNYAKEHTNNPELLTAIGKKMKLIDNIEATLRNWEKCKKQLLEENAESEYFQKASIFLKDLQKDTPYWTWPQQDGDDAESTHGAGVQERKKAIAVKGLLDAFFHAKNVLMSNPTEKEIRECKEEMERARNEAQAYLEMPYVRRLHDCLDAPLARLKMGEEKFEKIEEVLKALEVAQNKAHQWNLLAKRLERNEVDAQETKNSKSIEEMKRENYRKIITESPNYATILKELDKIIDGLDNANDNSEDASAKTDGSWEAKPSADVSFENIRNSVNMLRPAIQSLREQTLQVRKLEELAVNKEFRKILDFQLAFDKNAEWGHVSELKLALENYVKLSLKKDMEAVSYLFDCLDEKLKGRLEKDLLMFEDNAAMAGVFSCDCFQKPFPSKKRTTPCGKYDEILGIEYFYAFLNGLNPEKTVSRPYMTDISIHPRIESAYNALKDIESTLNYLHDNFSTLEWLARNGMAKETLGNCQKLLDRRNDIIEKQLARQDEPGSRDFLISRGIALYLSPNADKTEDLRMLVKSFKNYKSKLNELVEEKYDRASFEDRIKNRKEILVFGLPGYGLIKELWQEESEARSKP